MFIGFYSHHLSFMPQAPKSLEKFPNHKFTVRLRCWVLIRPPPDANKSQHTAWKESAHLFDRNCSERSATIKVNKPPPPRLGDLGCSGDFPSEFPRCKMGVTTNLASSWKGLLWNIVKEHWQNISYLWLKYSWNISVNIEFGVWRSKTAFW